MFYGLVALKGSEINSCVSNLMFLLQLCTIERNMLSKQSTGAPDTDNLEIVFSGSGHVRLLYIVTPKLRYTFYLIKTKNIFIFRIISSEKICLLVSKNMMKIILWLRNESIFHTLSIGGGY